MSTPKNPLDLLNLSGLSKLEDNIDLEESVSLQSFAAGDGDVVTQVSPPQPATLGDLAQLPGTWVGEGFNLIEVPNMNMAKPGPPPPDKFKVILNKTKETLVFSAIGGEIINRGNEQNDISYLGLHYLQQVSDVNLPEGKNGIHLETGLFLNVIDPKETPATSIARLGSIPHGDSILAQGASSVTDATDEEKKGEGMKIEFGVADPTPIIIDQDGKRKRDHNASYLELLKEAIIPKGISQDALMDPNTVLRDAIKGQKIIKTVKILLDANPIEGVSNVSAPVGGITNIPFVTKNANATTLSAIFWIETVQIGDNEKDTFLQLQYSQTVILDFPVMGPPPKNEVTQISWPHISVATLRLQPNK